MIPLTEIQRLITAFRENSQRAANRGMSTFHNTGDDLVATGFFAEAGTYEQCARSLEAVVSEWNYIESKGENPEVQI